jgi:DNA polymerase-3 subunit gamma/tau
MLGTAGAERLTGLVAHLVERDAAAAIGDLDAAVDEGVDVGQLLEQLLGYFRDLMAASVGCPPQTFLHTSAAEHERLQATGAHLGLETILAVMQIIDQTLSRLRYTTQGRTLAEMAIVRIARLEDLEALADVIRQVRSGAPVNATTSVSAGPVAAKKKGELTPAAPTNGGAPAATSNAQPGAASAPAIELTDETVELVWKEALANLTDLLADNAALAASVAMRSPERLVATFRAKYTSCKSFCERPEQLAKLEAALAEASGARIKVEFAVVEDEQSDQGPRRPVGHRQRLAEKSEHPLVRRASELFDARVVRIEEPNG